VQVVNLNNGTRLETYVIEGPRGSGEVCLNGPAARLGMVGDTVIVICYALMDEQEARRHQLRVVHVNERNQVAAPVGV
jgi:aspartate 1-decarboxylase